MANIFGFEITKANGKTNWQDIRRTMYVALIVWMIGVRFLNLNPFDDFVRKEGVGLDTLVDSACLYGIWLLTWHWLWSLRPKFG